MNENVSEIESKIINSKYNKNRAKKTEKKYNALFLELKNQNGNSHGEAKRRKKTTKHIVIVCEFI